jgi:broad specificity phosphatase PhoE
MTASGDLLMPARWWGPILSLLLLSPALGRAAEHRTGDTGMPALVVLVRHAEKADEPAGDPPLTKAGTERAKALEVALKDAGVTAIVTSEKARTRATAEPLARARGITPKAVGVVGERLASHVQAVLDEIRRHPGGVVLVVGHSDSVPALIEALGGPHLPVMNPDEYSRLFLLVPGPGGARLVQATYGAPD